jgi:hypothetical protein
MNQDQLIEISDYEIIDISENIFIIDKPEDSISPENYVRIYYRLFRCFAKRILMNNKYYHIIFGNIYTTDGRKFIGKDIPEDEFDDLFHSNNRNPDCIIKLICCCYCFCICCCESVFEEKHVFVRYDESMNILATYKSSQDACKALKVDPGKLLQLCEEGNLIKRITIDPYLNLE